MKRLVMITGPIASGKSTLAGAVSHLLRQEGVSVACTDLDSIAEMGLPTLPEWGWAHSVHADLVAAWLSTDIDLVVDEGTSTPEEVSLVLHRIPRTTAVLHVLLSADYEASLLRAQADPRRGLSRDPAFLRADHDTHNRLRSLLPCDLLVNVETRAPDELARLVVSRLGCPSRRK